MNWCCLYPRMCRLYLNTTYRADPLYGGRHFMFCSQDSWVIRTCSQATMCSKLCISSLQYFVEFRFCGVITKFSNHILRASAFWINMDSVCSPTCWSDPGTLKIMIWTIHGTVWWSHPQTSGFFIMLKMCSSDLCVILWPLLDYPVKLWL